MERKLLIADFAALVGTTSKTIYKKINEPEDLPVNERLITVKEKIKGREVTLIVTNTDQINYYKSLYGKSNVIEGKYYETLTEDDSMKLVDNVNEPVKNINDILKNANTVNFDINIWNEFITVNKEANNRYEQKVEDYITVCNELAEVKGRQLLLEDKAGREGYYLNEINQLKTGNETVKKANEKLKYVIMVLFIVVVGLVMYIIMDHNVSQPVNNVSETVTNIQQPVTAQAPQSAKNVSNQRKK